MAYETFVLMQKAVEAQCEATATANAHIAELEKERDEVCLALDPPLDNEPIFLVAEVKELVSARDAALSQVAELKKEKTYWMGEYDGQRLGRIEDVINLQGRLNTVQKQNAEKDEAMASAKSCITTMLNFENITDAAKKMCRTVDEIIDATLSSSASNQFVRREVLEKAYNEIHDRICTAESEIASEALGGNIVKKEFWKGELSALIGVAVLLRPCLTRAESALKSGGQEG